MRANVATAIAVRANRGLAAENNRLIGEVHKANRWLADRNQSIADLQNQLASPAKLLLATLHPDIRCRSEQLFLDGHLDPAVFDAMKAVEDRLRNIVPGCDGFSGAKLIGHLMGGPTPHVRFGKLEGEHDGAHSLFRGAIQWFRNQHGHQFVGIRDEAQAFEVIGFASSLMRLLDSATITP
jgi:uncharacterized protein (TIGR02391 family)